MSVTAGELYEEWRRKAPDPEIFATWEGLNGVQLAQWGAVADRANRIANGAVHEEIERGRKAFGDAWATVENQRRDIQRLETSLTLARRAAADAVIEVRREIIAEQEEALGKLAERLFRGKAE